MAVKRLRRAKGAVQVHVNHMLEKCRGHFFAPGGDGGAVDQDGQPRGGGGEGGDGLAICHVKLGVGEISFGLGGFGFDAGDGDLRASGVKGMGNRRPDPGAAGTDDQHLGPRKVECG